MNSKNPGTMKVRRHLEARGFTDSTSMDSILNHQWNKLWIGFQNPRGVDFNNINKFEFKLEINVA